MTSLKNETEEERKKILTAEQLSKIEDRKKKEKGIRKN